MFRNLLSRLFSDKEQGNFRLKSEDAEVAIAALLIRVARADDRYSADEERRIERVLARRRGLNESEAAERRMAAEMIEAEAPDTVRLTRTIKDRIVVEDRIEVIAALWEIALADGRRTPDEEAVVRLACGLLGISDVDSAHARQMVMKDMGLA